LRTFSKTIIAFDDEGFDSAPLAVATSAPSTKAGTVSETGVSRSSIHRARAFDAALPPLGPLRIWFAEV